MSLKPVRFEIDLHLAAPVLTKAAGAVGIGTDAGMLRAPDGCPAFHYTHIKGHLREAWNHLSRRPGGPTAAFIERWLGTGSAPDFEPERGALGFAAYFRADSNPVSTERSRVQIDATTGATKRGALQVIESPWPSGATVIFSGRCHARVSDDDRAELLHWLRAGLRLIPALGALKGNGFGRLERVELSDRDDAGTALVLAPELAGAARIGLRVTPLDPFCFARVATGNRNHFAAEPHIPGAALVAALAARCRLEPGRFPALEQALAMHDRNGTTSPVAIRITDARAVQPGHNKRPVALPLSLVHVQTGLRDVTHQAEPGTVGGELPAFQPDWKERQWQDAQRALNPDHVDPRKVLLIRTEIDPDTRTSAENKLFSLETVVPDGCDWLANLDLARVGDRAALLAELCELLAEPLTHLGKTKARARVAIEAPFASSVPARNAVGALSVGDRIALYLQTSAALFGDDFQADSTGGSDALHQAYAAAFHTLSGRTLALSHFLAAQQLAGGEHWWRRSQPTGGYRPRVLTRAGSVFVLAVTGDAQGAAKCLDAWLQHGLPQPAGVSGGEDWRRNPWISANGYGEILLDLDLNGAIARSTP
jgi:hypothetical protein